VSGLRALDDWDMKLLTELCADASVPVPELSRRLGLNQSVAYSRIKRLRNRGVIAGFTVKVDERKLGMGESATVGLNIDPKERAAVLRAVAGVGGVRLVREVAGRFEVLVDVRAATVEKLHSLVYDVIGGVRGVSRVEVFIELSRTEVPVVFGGSRESGVREKPATRDPRGAAAEPAELRGQ